MHEKENKGRRISQLFPHSAGHLFPVLTILSFLLLNIIITPAFISCSKEFPVIGECYSDVELQTKTAVPGSGRLDIYIYNQDKLGRLDSYSRQTYENGLPSKIEIASRSGKKNVTVLVNWPQEELDWGMMNTLESIHNSLVYLDDETPSNPRLCGNAVINAGRGLSTLSLSALTARIRVESVKCSFKDRSYSGKSIENVKLYLTNVCTSSTIVPDTSPGNTYVNLGGLSQGDMAAFGAPDLLCKSFSAALADEASLPCCDFYCYPNDGMTADGGRPRTKLVIQGDMDGTTFYYPIEIGSFTGGTIRRNTSYNLNLVITRLGNSDPDTPVSPESLEAGVVVLPWIEGNPIIQKF